MSKKVTLLLLRWSQTKDLSLVSIQVVYLILASSSDGLSWTEIKGGGLGVKMTIEGRIRYCKIKISKSLIIFKESFKALYI